MANQALQIVEHDPAWVASFEQQRATLTVLLAPWLAGPVEHIGSTAVPGLRAKPVVDVLAPVRSLADARKAVPLLERNGWLHWADDPGRDYRMWFLRPRPDARTHHLHLIEDPARVESLLTFRDALRRDAGLRREYELLKAHLARQFPTDRDAYTDAKTDFVTRAVRSGLNAARPRGK